MSASLHNKNALTQLDANFFTHRQSTSFCESMSINEKMKKTRTHIHTLTTSKTMALLKSCESIEQAGS